MKKYIYILFSIKKKTLMYSMREAKFFLDKIEKELLFDS